MRLSLICEDSSSADLAIKIIKLISEKFGDDLDLENETFTADFLANTMKEEDRVAAYKAKLLVDAGAGRYKLSDKALGMVSGEKGKSRGVLDKIMSGAPGYNQIKGAFRELQGK